MALTISISKADDLPAVEKRIVALKRAIDAAAHPETSRITEFEARLLSDWSDHLFKEQWAGMAIADGLSQAGRKTVKASGLTKWPDLADEAFQVSIPSLLSLQRDADVTLSNSLDPFNAEDARRYVVDRGGLLGQDSGRWRCLVELDPHAGVAPVLNTELPRRDALLGLVRSILDQLEVGAYGKREPGRDLGARGTVLEFLSELHTNGWEHARVGKSVRTLRLTKHLYLQRDSLAVKAGGFGELQGYVRNQTRGNINLIEVSVSDFGPGILDGFLQSFAGKAFREAPRTDVLDRLLHEKLSAKAGDPNAGLGIRNALEAARSIWGFVSLRTGEFWFTLDGSSREGEIRLVPREGRFPKVQGTHWQLLYPDMVSGGATHGGQRASI
jgi:hypothetical protein